MSYHGFGDKMHYSFLNAKVNSSDIEKMGRDFQEELKYDEKLSPIVLFGCSFALGIYLEDEQTFAYKLSQLSHRNVINRAVGGGSLSHMLYQTQSDYLYKKVPYSNDVIYILIDESTIRLLLDFYLITLKDFNLHYKKVNNDLVLVEYKNPFLNLFKSLYLVKVYQQYKIYKYVNDEKNSEEISDLELLYFIKARENLENRWNTKVNFNVIIYNNGCIKALKPLKEKLAANGFNVIDTNDLTDEILTEGKYIIPNDGHPTEDAWDLLTPLIYKKLKL